MNVREQLAQIFSRRTCLVGIGNELRSDDGIGVAICKRLLLDSLPAHIKVLNVEDVIESYVFEIAESDFENILLIDAVRCEARPGALILGRLEDLGEIKGELSTHKLSFSMTERIFKEHGKDTFLLGIAVSNIDYGTKISGEVAAAGEAAAELIRNGWSEQKSWVA